MMGKRSWLWGWVGLGVLVIVPWVLVDPFLQRMATMIMISGTVAIGLGVLAGDAGMISLGHAAFVGIGAYTSALVTMRLGWPFAAGFLSAGVLSGLVAFGFALPVLRLRGHFLALATLAFVELMQSVFLNWESVTNGPNGLPGVPPASLFGFDFLYDNHYYYLALATFVLVFLALQRLRHSPAGRALAMLREDEIAAAALGVHTAKFKALAFAVSAVPAGLAGSILAHYMVYVSPEPFSAISSFTYLAMVVLGGMYHPLGPLVGTVILEVLPEALRSVAGYRMLIYGAMLILMLPLRPEGILRRTLGRGSQPSGARAEPKIARKEAENL